MHCSLCLLTSQTRRVLFFVCLNKPDDCDVVFLCCRSPNPQGHEVVVPPTCSNNSESANHQSGCLRNKNHLLEKAVHRNPFFVLLSRLAKRPPLGLNGLRGLAKAIPRQSKGINYFDSCRRFGNRDPTGWHCFCFFRIQSRNEATLLKRRWSMIMMSVLLGLATVTIIAGLVAVQILWREPRGTHQ